LRTLKPVWEQSFEFLVPFKASALLFSVWDKDIFSKDDFLGVSRYPLEKLFSSSRPLEVELPLEKLNIPKFKNEEVGGFLKCTLSMERIVPKQTVCHFSFNGHFRRLRYVQDDSKFGHRAFFKNLKTDVNISKVRGSVKGSFAARFDGFNFIECRSNPLKSLGEFTISVLFWTDDPTIDQVIVAAMTTDPNLIAENESNHISEYYQSKDDDKEEGTKKFKSGFFIGTTKNSFFSNTAEPLSNESLNIFENDNVFFPHTYLTSQHKIIERDEAAQENEERSSLFNPKEWNHIVVTYDGNIYREYINGIMTDSVSTGFDLLGDGKSLQM